jgi:phage terminase large subunit-like protein
MFLGPSGLRNVIPDQALETGDWDGSFNETRLELRLANGSVITGYSSERPGRIRGDNLSGFWGDEPAEWKDSSQLPLELNTTFSNLMLAVRENTEGGTRGIITGTPTPCPLLAGNAQHEIPGLLTGMQEPPMTVVRMSTRDNLENLDASFTRLIMSLEGTRLGRQEIDAELLTDIEGAAWKNHWIVVDDTGLTLQFDRMVIAVDPSGSDGQGDGDEVGIVVCGLSDGQYWVLEDLSGGWGPGEWSELVWDAYKRWEPQSYRAPHIKVEGNYGKELAAQPLRVSQDRVPGIDIDIKPVRGSKYQRAKATAQIYEPTLQKATGVRVRHAGRFHLLTSEMTTFLPESGWSPNRMDALTLGMNWLAEFDELPQVAGSHGTTLGTLLGRHSGGYR